MMKGGLREGAGRPVKTVEERAMATLIKIAENAELYPCERVYAATQILFWKHQKTTVRLPTLAEVHLRADQNDNRKT